MANRVYLSIYLSVFISICYIYVENNAVNRGVKPLFIKICVCVCVCMDLKANQRSDDYMKALTLLTIVDRELFSRISCNLQTGK